MKRKVLAGLLVATMLATMLGTAGCGKEAEKTNQDTTQVTGEAAKEMNFVYLSPSTESEYWQYNEVGMRNAIADIEAETGVKINLTVSGPASEKESDAYIKAFESVIATKPDAIITATLIPDGTVPKVQEAQNAGIYVNFLAMGLEGGNSNKYGDYYGVHYYCDNTIIGETAAQIMLDGLKKKGIEPKGKIGMHMSVIVATLEERMDGFKAYMKEHAPDLECLDTLYNENDVSNAQANAENQISTYGDELIGLYGGNNVSGDGIALAIKGANLGDKIRGVGVDSDSLEIEALRAGNLFAIIVQTPYEQGYSAVQNAFTYVQTGKNEETQKHVNCTSQAITQENMNTDASKALLNPKILAK